MRLIWILGIGLGLGISVFGATSETGEQPVVVQVESRRPPRAVLQPEDRITVRLNFSSGTNYQWKLTTPVDASVLEQVGEPTVVKPPRNPDVPVLGNTAFLEYTFKAVAPGQVFLSFEYASPDTKPSDEYDLKVKVEAH